MEVIEIVKEYLVHNKYDGLVQVDCECGCDLEELASCDGGIVHCEPGYKIECECGGGCNYHITTKKPNNQQPTTRDPE